MRTKKRPHVAIRTLCLLVVAAVPLGISPVQSALTAQAPSENGLTPLETLLNPMAAWT